MMKLKTWNVRPEFVLLFFVVLLTLWACGKDPVNSNLTIQLNHAVQGEPVELENLKYPCEAGHTYSVVNLKYYLSNIVLHTDDGQIAAQDLVHLFDIHKTGTDEIRITDLPRTNFKGLSFVFGLDENINIDGGLENNLENINMEWPIPGDQGYHYMKFEGRYDSLNTGTLRSFNMHTGATMGNQNYIHVNLPFAENFNGVGDWMIKLNMDLHEWMHNPFIFDFVGNERIMMNQATQEILKANGATVFRIQSINEF